MDTPTEIIAAYDELVGRAAEILSCDPPRYYNHSFLAAPLYQLSIMGRTARLEWHDESGEYAHLSSFEFPTALLSLSDDGFEAWKLATQQCRHEDEAARKQANQERRKQEELATLADLKAKYEGA